MTTTGQTRTQYKRLSKQEYVEFLSKYDDLTQEQIVEISEKAYK